MADLVDKNSNTVLRGLRVLEGDELRQQKLESFADERINGGRHNVSTYGVQQGPRARKICEYCRDGDEVKADYKFQWHIAYADYICEHCLEEAEKIAGKKATVYDKDNKQIRGENKNG